MSEPLVFRIDVADDELARIRRRVADYEWPEFPTGPGLADSWDFGANQPFMQRLCRYWLEQYDWRRWEAELNALPQFRAPVDDVPLHFYHERGSGERPRPLLLIHGWPGSVFEFRKLVEPLAHPERFGGDVTDAFSVVVPSLPGYGFSGKPAAPLGPRQVASMLDRLMTDTLGYESYIAQGGDWGAIISGWLGYEAPGCSAIHLNLMGWQAPGVIPANEEEKRYFDWLAALRAREMGYAEIQKTKPQSLAYAMMDSPVGVCAWIVEKFHRWSDIRRGFEATYSFDELLTNVMIYLVTRSFNTASWLYYGRANEGGTGTPVLAGARVERPTAVAAFPYEFVPFPPRSYVERNVNVVRWTDFDRGGHFAALECADELIADVRAFARQLNA